jgi:UDP-3-O-[3-hydroxymyristoyl] glucosamine N-acyltransferase
MTRFRLGELAERVGGRVVGDSARTIAGVASLERAGPGDLAFLTNPRYRRAAESTRAGAVLVAEGTEVGGRDLLVAKEPYAALATILALFAPETARKPGVSPLAAIGSDVRLGDAVEIGPFAFLDDGAAVGDRATVGAGCVLGRGASLGEETVLLPRVVLYPGTRVGARCRIHAGVVIGGDGFGFASTGGKHRKVPQLGSVVVGDDVEIGANTTIDRGAVGDTIVGSGTKIDNLVMVAHGVEIGEHGLLVAQSGIAGSTKLGNGVTIAAQSGVAGHLTLGDRSAVAAKTAVFQDVEAGEVVSGIPAVPHREWKRSAVLQRRLPELLAELKDLRARVERLEKKSGGSS